MAADITLKCGTGVDSITYAWVNSSGTRVPASGTKTTYGSVDMKACDHVWISSVTASSGYTSPYKIDNTSFTSNYTYYPSVGGTKNVFATKIQTSYKVRLDKYVDNVYQTKTTFTTTNQIMSETAVKKKIPSSWASSDIELKDPWFGTLSGCRYDQNEGEFTFTSTSPIINVAYRKIVVPTYNYYLRYDAKGGTGEPNAQSTLGTTATSVTFRVSSTEPTRTNYTFLGWSFDSTATKADYVGGDTVTLKSGNPDRTLYAVWKYAPRTYTITVDYYDDTSKAGLSISGGGSYQHGSVITLTATPRTGYAFDGWYTYISGVWTRESANQNYDVTVTGAMTYYAKANKIAPTIPTATIEITGATSSSLSVKATLTNVLTFSDRWYLCISTDPTFSSYSSIQGSGSSVSHTFTGLSAHTTYYFKVVNVYNEQRAWQSSYTTGTTKYASFVWDHNDNLDNRRPTANEWTRLVSFVETVAGVTVSAAAKETIYVGGTLSHILFNELAQDVGLAQTASKGTRILKSVLNALRDKANTLR